MKSTLVLLVLSFITTSSFGAPIVRWQRQFGGEHWDRNSSLVLTSKNEPVFAANIVLHQEIHEKIPGIQSVEQLFQGNLIKFSADNREQWRLKTSGSGSLSLYVTDRDAQDHIVVYGTAKGQVSFAGQEVPFGPGARLLDLHISSEGELLKVERHRFWGHKRYAVRLVRNDEDAKRFGLKYEGVLRLMAAKLDAERKPLWIRQVAEMEGTTRMGNTQMENLSVFSGRMVEDPEGNFQVLSIFRPKDGAGPYRCVLTKLDDKGNTLWSQELGKGAFRVQQLLADGKGNVYLVGFARGEISFGDRALTANQRADVFVAKISPNGECRWVAHGGGPGRVSPRAADVDHHGNTYLGGSLNAQGKVKFGAFEFEPESSTQMMFLTKLNPRGEFQWLRTYTGKGQAEPDHLKAGSNGWIYLSGDFGGLTGGSLRTEAGELMSIPSRKASVTPGIGEHHPTWEIFLMGLR